MADKKKILIVDDERGLRITLQDRLRSEGYDVQTSEDGPKGLAAMDEASFDLVILDVMMPGMSGLDVCQEMRKQGNGVPVLMLTAKGQTLDKVVGLKMGADDYLTKPFETVELLARVEALLRRGGAALSGGIRRFADVEVDRRRTEVRRNGEPLTVSAKEYQLLCYMLDYPEETLSRERLLQKVWGYESTPSTRTVDVHVAWLRQKLEENPKQPKHIVTVHGLGYQFRPGTVKDS